MRLMLRVYNQRQKSPSPSGSRSPSKSPIRRPRKYVNQSPNPDYPDYPEYPQCNGPRARTNVQITFRRYEDVVSDDESYYSAGEPSAPAPGLTPAMTQGDGPVDGAKHRDTSPGSGDDTGELGDLKGKASDKSKVKGKVIRVLTVMAYVLSVSLAAIMLSMYYVFLWDPKMPGGTGPAGRLESDPPAEGSYAWLSAPPGVEESISPPSFPASVSASDAREVNVTDDDAGVTQGFVSTAL